MKGKKIFVNALTIIRLLATFVLPFIWRLTSPLCIFIFVVTILLTDMLDGIFARSFHVQSLFGSILDAVADKTLGVTGDRYELATDLRPRGETDTPKGKRARINSLYPLREKQQEEILQEYARSYHDELGVQLDGSPTVAAVCWKVLWFPSAVVADTALLPFWIIGFPWASSIATRFYENRGW